jgi:hypothetical protein
MAGSGEPAAGGKANHRIPQRQNRARESEADRSIPPRPYETEKWAKVIKFANMSPIDQEAIGPDLL